MVHSFAMRLVAGVAAVIALFIAPSARALNPAASLFICDVPASQGGCANGGSSPEGFVFTFSGMTDSFVGGLPVTSPAQAAEAGTDLPDLGLAKIVFSFSWLAMGSNTPEQTIFFTTAGGKISDVLDYAYGREGLDLTNVAGYVISAQTPVTAAQLENDGIIPTGSASAGGLFNFPNTDITATFQTAIPEPSTWATMLLGFAGIAFASLRRPRRSRVASAHA